MEVNPPDMKNNAVLRVGADLCFYFSILHIFDAFRRWRLPMALFAAACFALGFLIVRFRQKPVRFLLALLPGLCFLLAESSPLLIFPGFAWLYYILVMTAGNYALPLDEYRRSYRILLVIALFFIVANIFNSTIYRGHLISPESLIYVFLFLVLGVLAMRGMQMGATMDHSWQFSNVLSVIGVPLLAIGGSTLVYLILRFCAPGIRFLLAPIGRFFIWLFHQIFKDGSPIEEMSLAKYFSTTNVTHYEELPIEGNSSFEGGDAEPSGRNPLLVEHAAMIGAYVVLAVLLLLALWLIIRYAKRNRPLDEGEDLLYEQTEADGTPVKKQRRKKKNAMLFGPSRQIRRTYLLYLEHVRGRGAAIGKADTSQDVLEATQKIMDAPEAVRLREIYIAARYGDPAAIGHEQVREAQQCLDAILSKSR